MTGIKVRFDRRREAAVGVSCAICEYSSSLSFQPKIVGLNGFSRYREALLIGRAQEGAFASIKSGTAEKASSLLCTVMLRKRAFFISPMPLNYQNRKEI